MIDNIIQVDARRTDVVLSNLGFSAPGWFLLNDPPITNLPRNNAVERINDPQYVKMEWFPRHLGSLNSAFPTQYKIELFPMRIPGMNPNHIVMGMQPEFYDVVSTTSYYLSFNNYMLEPGVQYAWRVQAVSDDGIILFQNNGYSEVQVFSYGDPCPVPQNITATIAGAEAVIVAWDSDQRHTNYELQFRLKDGANHVWNKSESYTSNIDINNLLTAGKQYEYQVKAGCNTHESGYSDLFTFELPKSLLSTFQCGLIDEDTSITNKAPKLDLWPDEVIYNGQFPVRLVEVRGGNGTFSGIGRLAVPFLANIQVLVEFKDITVNEMNLVVRGEMRSIYNADSKFLINVPLKEKDVQMDSELIVVKQNSDTSDHYENNTDFTLTTYQNDSILATESDLITLVENIVPTGDEEIVQTDTIVELQQPVLVTGNPNPVTNNPDGASPTNTEPVVKIWKVLDGKEYEKGSKINVDYHSIEKHMSFKLKNYPENTQEIEWKFFINNIDLAPVLKRQDLTFDQFGCNVGGKFGDIKLKAIYDDKEIEVGIVVLKEEFELKEMYAKHKGNRIAKSSEILYLIDEESVGKNSEQISYNIALSPDTHEDKFESLDIVWSYVDQTKSKNQQKEFGIKSISRNLLEDYNILSTSVSAGFPEKKTKSIDVKWVDQKMQVKNLTNKFVDFLSFFKLVNEVSDMVETVAPCNTSFLEGFDRNIIWRWTTFNEEDILSRHILETKRFEFAIESPNLASFSCEKGLGVTAFGYEFSLGKIYFDFSAGANISIRDEDVYYLENYNKKDDYTYVQGGITASGKGGLKGGIGHKDEDGTTIGIYYDANLNVTGGGRIEYPYLGNADLIAGLLYIDPLMYNFIAIAKLGPLDKEFTYSDILWDIRIQKISVYNMKTNSFE